METKSIIYISHGAAFIPVEAVEAAAAVLSLRV